MKKHEFLPPEASSIEVAHRIIAECNADNERIRAIFGYKANEYDP